MADLFILLSAGFILLFAAIFLWIWVVMTKRRKQRQMDEKIKAETAKVNKKNTQ